MKTMQNSDKPDDRLSEQERGQNGEPGPEPRKSDGPQQDNRPQKAVKKPENQRPQPYLTKSGKLDNVCYDIRGENVLLARQMEEDGHRIYQLNTGNTYPFGFNAPEEIIQDVIHNIPKGQGYISSKGLFPARKAIMQESQILGIQDIDIEDIYMGNGASELINMALQALLNNGDEVLIPCPDYPLWTACTSLAGGLAVHYLCDESNGWLPDLDDIRSKISARTKALVVINPNNPTGAVYPKETLLRLLEIAREYKLLVFADEIYQKITFNGIQVPPIASLCEDLFVITFNGLSKAYRLPGFRVGWMILSGHGKRYAADFIEGLDILSSMRLCSNVPGQYAVQTALGGYQSIGDLLLPQNRLNRQREYCYKRILEIPGLSSTEPEGALYFFPKLDKEIYQVEDDAVFARELLREKKIFLVQGTGFNQKDHQHFRITFLPPVFDLEIIFDGIADFLAHYND
ncbi:pyridoxal phosphate-dependent aminotransferase [Candidatus Haliotispira prima]|uniref:alanine transaminase n=1 Tax=Candidatus Haliotispira prima TaxID=3034016 RepID=A0ABY8MJ07_9SPIO|nr:pyridoxal phosphate-dependent aminotransferase [Candidatus Haliotispira prima]